MVRLYFYRVFVEPLKQQQLFPNKQLSKQDVLRKAFLSKEPQEFLAGKNQLALITQLEHDDLIYASLAKKSEETIFHSPQEKLEAETIESWPHVRVFISTSPNHNRGQVLAIESKSTVFRNTTIQLEAFQRHANKLLESTGYEINIHPVVSGDKFWDIINANRGQIRELSFRYSAPNLFSLNNNLNTELKDAQREFMLTKARVSFENPSGQLNIDPQNDFIKQSVEYVSKGGGDYTVKARRVYKSKDSISSQNVDEVELEVAVKDENSFKQFCDKLFLWLDS